MSRLKKFIILVGVLMILSLTLIAQDPGPDPGGDPDAPIDDYLPALFIFALGYGIYSIKKNTTIDNKSIN